MELLRDAGLDGEVIGCKEENRKTWIWRDGQAGPLSRRLPVDGADLDHGRPAQPSTELRRKTQDGEPNGFADPLPAPPGDTPVAEFVGDHFGQEAMDYLAEPLLSGIYGGEPALLSAESVLPKFVELERKYGSVARGVRKEPSKATGPRSRLCAAASAVGREVSVPYERAGIETVEPDSCAGRRRMDRGDRKSSWLAERGVGCRAAIPRPPTRRRYSAPSNIRRRQWWR